MRITWLVLIGALAGGDGGSEATVEIRTFRYREALLEIPVGTRVTWTNRDQIEHTVTSGVPDSADGTFAGSLPGPDSAFSFTFERAGTYRYFCARHQFMRGEVRAVTSTNGAR